MHDRLGDLVGDRLEQLDLVAAGTRAAPGANVQRALEHFAADEDRYGEDRLVLVLLQVRELLEARVEVRRGRDHHGRPLGRRAAGDALTGPHARPSRHLVDARPMRGPEDELVGPRVVERDEARVGTEGVRDLLGHEMEHLFEIERRVDGGCRLGEEAEVPLGRIHPAIVQNGAPVGAPLPGGCASDRYVVATTVS